jgi:hypothetical protein
MLLQLGDFGIAELKREKMKNAAAIYKVVK